jgi:ABC-2 type transport system permease protein
MNVWLFARQELIALRRDHRAWAAVACLFVLLAAAFVSGAQTHRAYEQTRSDAQAASHRQWLTQGTKNPHSAAHFGVYAFRPLPEAATFEPGLHGVLGTTIYLEAHRANPLRDAPDEYGARSTYLDGSAAFLARTVVPLLIFLLVAASVAGERERGTLKMLLAQGSTLLRVALGKTLAFGVWLIVLVAGAALAAGAVSGADPGRIAGLAASYSSLAFAALFVAMAVSIAARDARRAVVILFALWSVGAVLAPRAVASIASAVAPMPLRSEAQEALERELDSAGYERRTDELRQRVLAEHGVTKVDELPFDFRGLALQSDEERGNAIFDRHWATLREHEQRQEAVLRGLALFLPWLALEQVSTAFAGTDLRHAEHFADAAERYRRDLVGRMNGHLIKNRGADANESLWSTITEFAYDPPGARFALGYGWTSLAVLVGWIALSLSAVFLLAQRARVIGEAA